MRQEDAKKNVGKGSDKKVKKRELCAVRHVEAICKNEGFSVMTSRKCKLYVITRVLGNAHSRQVRVGIKMLEYFNREEALLTGNMSINISSDIIESTFGIYKSKKSPNKLYGVTSFTPVRDKKL